MLIAIGSVEIWTIGEYGIGPREARVDRLFGFLWQSAGHQVVAEEPMSCDHSQQELGTCYNYGRPLFAQESASAVVST